MSAEKDSQTLISSLNRKDITEELALKEIKEYFSSPPLELEASKKSIEYLKILIITNLKIFTALLNECCKSIEDEISIIGQESKDSKESKESRESKLIFLCKFLMNIFNSLFQSNKEAFFIEENISLVNRILDLLIKLLFLPNFTVLKNKNKNKNTNTNDSEIIWFTGKESEDKLLNARKLIIKALITCFSQKIYKNANEFLDPFLTLFLSNKNESNLLYASFLNAIIYSKLGNLKGSKLNDALELSSSACNLCYLLITTKLNSKNYTEKLPKWAEKVMIEPEGSEKEMGLSKNFQFRNFFEEYILGLNDPKYLNEIVQGIIFNISESAKNPAFLHILKSNINFLLIFLNETQVINILGQNDYNLMQIWISLSSLLKKFSDEITPSTEDYPIIIVMIYELLSKNRYFSILLNAQAKIKVNLNNNKSSYADMFYTFLFEFLDSIKINQQKINLSLLNLLANTSYFILTLNKATANIMAKYLAKVLNEKDTEEKIRNKYTYQLLRIYYGLLKFHYFGNLEVASSLFPLIELLEKLIPKDEEANKSNPYFKIIFSYLDYYYKGFSQFPPVEYLELTAFQGIIPDDCIEIEILKENDDISLRNMAEIAFWNNLIKEEPEIFDLSLIKSIPVKQK